MGIYRKRLSLVSFLSVVAAAAIAFAAVPQGSEKKARAYYQQLSKVVKYPVSGTILDSTLNDVLVYTGYFGLSAQDLQRIAPEVLMEPDLLGKPCLGQIDGSSCPSAVSDPVQFRQSFTIVPPRTGDILAARFFAPKIINVNEPPETRQLGWRKLVRLRSRPGSPAAKNGIEAAIILFNFFTKPSERPFEPLAESVNTQVMLVATATDRGNKDSLYWLDYGPLSKGGKLSFQLDATFDAADLQASKGTGAASGVKPYYVPDGCNACHGAADNPKRPLVNYLDTDHWFDRAETDLARVRDERIPVLFDAQTDDATAPDFARAFDIIRRFNEEAARQVAATQPKAFHLLATNTWLRLHEQSNGHIKPIDRAVPSSLAWTPQSNNDEEMLNKLNQYCFRCHGTIKFNVFEKVEVKTRRAQIRSRLRPSAAQLQKDPGFLMPPDRKLDDKEIARIIQLLP